MNHLGCASALVLVLALLLHLVSALLSYLLGDLSLLGQTRVWCACQFEVFGTLGRCDWRGGRNIIISFSTNKRAVRTQSAEVGLALLLQGGKTHAAVIETVSVLIV